MGPEALSFKVTQQTQAELKELGLGVDDAKKLGMRNYPAMTKVLRTEASEDREATSFTLHISEGSFTDAEVIGMLGQNGTGKTTYMEILAGIYDKEKAPAENKENGKEGGEGGEQEEPKKKEFDCEAVSLPGQAVSVSYKKQDYAPKFRRYKGTVRELLERNVQMAFTNSLFKMFVMRPLRMDELLDLHVNTLSGGELQRLAILVCLGTPAHVYLLDEPSAGLDCEQRVIVAKVIRRWLVSHMQRTVFVIEHDAMMMSALADRMILFSGRPGVEANASSPMTVYEGFNAFLKQLDVTFRRDPVNHRPRINKPESVKDREQKQKGEYYKFDTSEKDMKGED